MKRLLYKLKTQPGDIYNYLTVIELVEKIGTKRKKIAYLCKCKCGNEKVVVGEALRSGHTKSCGCHKKMMCKESGSKCLKHNMTKTKTYAAWINMRRGCNSKGYRNYEYFGFRGISYCKEWDEFKNFLEDMGEKQENLLLLRKDKEKDFSKENCYWGTK